MNDKDNMNGKTPNEFIKQLEKNAKKDKNGIEFWSAKVLQKILEYDSWPSFEKVIKKAQAACEIFGQPIDDHFIGNAVAPELIQDFKLTRYACYLIVLNADAEKKIVALAQTYFAVQTRRQEAQDKENNKRIDFRSNIKVQNKILSRVAQKAGVIGGTAHAIFQNKGYEGLYDGKKKRDIAEYKGLQATDDILDHMGSEELGANMFRITQTAAKIEKDNINSKQDANDAHFDVGKAIRDMMVNKPEDLAMPAESIKELERAEKKREKAIEKLKQIIVELSHNG